MELKHIRSTDLPKLSGSVMERVNQGRWTLYRSHEVGVDPAVAYYIKGDERLYRLDGSGEVLSIGTMNQAPRVDELIYFSDIASPPSLSEGRGRATAR